MSNQSGTMSLYDIEILLDYDIRGIPYDRIEVPPEKYLENPAFFITKGNSGFSVMSNPKIRLKVADRLYEFRQEKNFPHLLDKIFYEKILRRSEFVRKKQSEILAYLCEQQADYMESENPLALKKITQKDVSSHLGCHCSRISRLVKNLTVQLPSKKVIFARRLIPGAKTTGYRSRSALKELANCPEYSGCRSDEQIGHLLRKKFGIKIARRTVSKYMSMSQICD